MVSLRPLAYAAHCHSPHLLPPPHLDCALASPFGKQARKVWGSTCQLFAGIRTVRDFCCACFVLGSSRSRGRAGDPSSLLGTCEIFACRVAHSGLCHRHACWAASLEDESRAGRGSDQSGNDHPGRDRGRSLYFLVCVSERAVADWVCGSCWKKQAKGGLRCVEHGLGSWWQIRNSNG